jgi:hypothetical protein
VGAAFFLSISGKLSIYLYQSSVFLI